MPEFWFGMILLIVFSVGGSGLPGHLPRRRAVHPRRRHELAGGLARRRLAPRAARHDPRGHLPRRVLAGDARLAHRRDGAGLPADRAGQGPADKMVRRRHAVPNALLPTTTLIFLNLGFVVGGAITIEYVFSHPRPRLAHRRSAAGPGRPAAAGAVPAVLRRGHPREPRRRPALRAPRPAGAHMSPHDAARRPPPRTAATRRRRLDASRRGAPAARRLDGRVPRGPRRA